MLPRYLYLIVVLLPFGISLCFATDTKSPPPNGIKDIKIVATQGIGSEKGRAAWLRLSKSDADMLPHILQAMNTEDIVTANWLRTAFDRILERDRKVQPSKVDADALLDFVTNTKNSGRARRFALGVVDSFRPGTTEKLLPGWLGDPEFRYDAVAALLTKAENYTKANEKKAAQQSYEKAFHSSRDIKQARTAAKALEEFGDKVSVAEHLGFLTHWYVIGPFDAKDKTGFATTYPPEKQGDLKATYKGQSKKSGWKEYRVEETWTGRHVALVNLRETRALGDADDAVAFAYTEITVPKSRTVEFRGAADDNFIVWVNGKRMFGFEEYSNGVRHDRHAFPVTLQKGKNTILVKICQSPPYIAPNWEFFLRIADETGKGVAFTDALK